MTARREADKKRKAGKKGSREALKAEGHGLEGTAWPSRRAASSVHIAPHQALEVLRKRLREIWRRAPLDKGWPAAAKATFATASRASKHRRNQAKTGVGQQQADSVLLPVPEEAWKEQSAT